MTHRECLAAEVAVAVPVAGSFHYLVPPDLAAIVTTGLRVLVPFGSRRVTGYVLELGGGASLPEGLPELKEITELLDEAPLFGPEMVPFFRFAADYYHYPLGMVIAEALPAGLKVMSHQRATLTVEGRSALQQGLAEPDELFFLERLNNNEGLVLSRLAREGADGLRLLRRARTRGWVDVDTHVQRERVRARKQRWLVPLPPATATEARLGPREKELLDILSDLGPSPALDFNERFSGLSAIVRRLEQKGCLKVEEREIYRDSLGRPLYFNGHTPEPTPQQAGAVAAVVRALTEKRFAPFLLHGVTGSGKTEVYLIAAGRALEMGRTALLLVPEISLTPAMEGLLRARFGENVAVLHSGLSEGERYDQWQKIRRREVRLVLGARSAVWAPLDDLGLIVVDEEHDGAYKQEDKLRYQARDLAVLRAQQCGAAVILGSATPSLESFNAARAGRYSLLTLDERVGDGRLPEVEVIDLRLDSAGRRRGALTPRLKTALRETLDRGEQALLFINRRGLAGLPICLSCGEVLKCLNCSVTLTLHQGAGEANRLVCHYCGYEAAPPERCPACGSGLFRYLGIGTERLEAEVGKAFPEARVGRLDADTARPKGELTRILEGLRDRELDILVGTQMITKGHDFPNITLVGVIDADLGLHLPDFRAGERVFQLLAQVGGRAGRGENPGRVIIQTLSPDHYSLRLARGHDYLGFFEYESGQRRELGYPPFSRLVLARFSGNSEERTREAAASAADLGREMLGQAGPELELLGPAPAPLAKVKGKHRFQILLRGERVRTLHDFLNRWLAAVQPALKGGGVSLAVDVDPYQMM